MTICEAPRRVFLLTCGCFNPITRMHTMLFELAKDSLERNGHYKVEGGIISPVHDQYKKEGLLESSHRLEMGRRATQEPSWVEVSDWEATRNNWSRTLDVLRHFREAKGTDIMLLCGSDLMQGMDNETNWRKSDVEEILKEYGMAVLQRGDSSDVKYIESSPLLSQFHDRIHLFGGGEDISSTKVREEIRAGKSISKLVHPSVAEYIKQHDLYRLERSPSNE